MRYSQHLGSCTLMHRSVLATSKTTQTRSLARPRCLGAKSSPVAAPVPRNQHNAKPPGPRYLRPRHTNHLRNLTPALSHTRSKGNECIDADSHMEWYRSRGLAHRQAGRRPRCAQRERAKGYTKGKANRCEQALPPKSCKICMSVRCNRHPPLPNHVQSVAKSHDDARLGDAGRDLRAPSEYLPSHLVDSSRRLTLLCGRTEAPLT